MGIVRWNTPPRLLQPAPSASIGLHAIVPPGQVDDWGGDGTNGVAHDASDGAVVDVGICAFLAIPCHFRRGGMNN